jgi:hypothetical protein
MERDRGILFSSCRPIHIYTDIFQDTFKGFGCLRDRIFCHPTVLDHSGRLHTNIAREKNAQRLGVLEEIALTNKMSSWKKHPRLKDPQEVLKLSYILQVHHWCWCWLRIFVPSKVVLWRTNLFASACTCVHPVQYTCTYPLHKRVVTQNKLVLS